LAGQYFDTETGLHYNYHRYYDPSVGRYLRPDPIGLFGGINLYLYAHSNPINLTDSVGLMSPDSIGMWMLIGEKQDRHAAAESAALNAFSNYSAGLGDALLLGFGDDFRDILGMDDIVDDCSDEYKYGAWSSFALGFGRIGYATLAKTGSLLASSGAAASAFRESLKKPFRLWFGRNWRKYTPPNDIDDAILRASAGKTNPLINIYGAGVMSAGAAGAID